LEVNKERYFKKFPRCSSSTHFLFSRRSAWRSEWVAYQYWSCICPLWR